MPEPLKNLLDLQQARIKLGEAGARAVTFRGEALSVTPIDLSDDQAADLRGRLDKVTIEPGRSQVTVRVPKDPLPVVSSVSSRPRTPCSPLPPRALRSPSPRSL